ncbi:YdiU family protein [Shewanella sp. GutDb-MelDb]|uniref:protein adenylyltransferase SelO n=1 Tax=Shewanella sp. GutDb-MelDb TaxID=2058316 RepID=UPI000C7B4CC8|nr:YdiU family protein [Shewanella sp. GutDb-MelDb]PKG58561.1 YdiU family protein [Shewanella sp. GutDb-MelDb]
MSSTEIDLGVSFDNSYANELKGFYVSAKGDKAPTPVLVKFNQALAEQLGISNSNTEQLADVFSGSEAPLGSAPLAQVYAGHQFGGFSPQLGDGRALLLGEVLDESGQRLDIQLKGSGRTQFSRGGDGKAVLGAILREYILCEAMHALGIATTRALAVVTTGEPIYRTRYLPGAVLTRVATSHLRVGTFQYFAAQGEEDKLKQLADYAIARHYPELKQSQQPYLDLICAVRDKQAELVAKWMLAGFVHGVMNTDNMTISGETIDYGPCAFMDNYDANALFSSIDQDGRYAYSNQPAMAQWDLARLAETLLPFINEDSDDAITQATDVIKGFWDVFKSHWLLGMRAKLGMTTEVEGDYALCEQLLESMQAQAVDYTQLFRQLAVDLTSDSSDAEMLFSDPSLFIQWKVQWHERLRKEPLATAERVTMMNAVNPVYIPRNHLVEAAIEAAEERSDYQPFEALISVLANPYTMQAGKEEFSLSAPASFGKFTTYCGT